MSEKSGMIPSSASSPARTLDEIRISIRLHSGQAAQSILQIGRDLIEAKQIAGHGGWLPFLREIGFSASTAENWMRLAREIQPESRLASLPYSKALALLALPAEEREDFAQAQDVESKTAAQIKTLIEERNRAAEAANTETYRANIAEKQLKEAEEAVEAAERRARMLGEQLDELLANPQKVTVEVEKVPDDYEELKRDARMSEEMVNEAIQAAVDAQERANALEEEVQRLRAQGDGAPQPGGLDALAAAVNAFIAATTGMLLHPEPLARQLQETDKMIRMLSRHVIDLQKAVGDADFVGSGAVV